MPKLTYARCRDCQGHRDEVGPISRRQLCAGCGEENLRENIESLATKTGPAYKRWRGGMIRYALTLQAERLQVRS